MVWLLGLGIHPALGRPLEGEDKIIERSTCKIDEFCLRTKGDFITIRQVVGHVGRHTCLVEEGTVGRIQINHVTTAVRKGKIEESV